MSSFPDLLGEATQGNRQSQPVFPLVGGRFFFRRKRPTPEELQEFWTKSKENDEEVNAKLSSLAATIREISWLGTIAVSPAVHRVAFGQDTRETAKKLTHSTSLTLCYEVTDGIRRGIREQHFTPVTLYAFNLKAKLGICDLSRLPTEALVSLSTEWNVGLEKIQPAPSSIVKRTETWLQQGASEIVTCGGIMESFTVPIS